MRRRVEGGYVGLASGGGGASIPLPMPMAHVMAHLKPLRFGATGPKALTGPTRRRMDGRTTTTTTAPPPRHRYRPRPQNAPKAPTRNLRQLPAAPPAYGTSISGQNELECESQRLGAYIGRHGATIFRPDRLHGPNQCPNRLQLDKSFPTRPHLPPCVEYKWSYAIFDEAPTKPQRSPNEAPTKSI